MCGLVASTVCDGCKRARGLLRDETHSQLPRRDTPTALPVPTGVAGKTRRLLDWPRKTDAVSGGWEGGKMFCELCTSSNGPIGQGEMKKWDSVGNDSECECKNADTINQIQKYSAGRDLYDVPGVRLRSHPASEGGGAPLPRLPSGEAPLHSQPVRLRRSHSSSALAASSGSTTSDSTVTAPVPGPAATPT